MSNIAHGLPSKFPWKKRNMSSYEPSSRAGTSCNGEVSVSTQRDVLQCGDRLVPEKLHYVPRNELNNKTKIFSRNVIF